MSIAHKKLKYRQIKKFLSLSLSDGVFIMLGILAFISRINFVLSRVEDETSLINWGPEGKK